MTRSFATDDRPPVHRHHFDPSSSDQLLPALAGALSVVTDRPPDDLPPIYETIDGNALEQLLEHSATAGVEFGATFALEGWDVCVTGAGEVLVYEETREADQVPSPQSDADHG